MSDRKLKVGDWVEVRSKEEVLRTLDRKGQLNGQPFMPEMFKYCGQRFQVFKRAHKTCDTVFPVRGRRLADSVHLETRCDGEAHGGCQAACLIFWKEAWLKRVDGPAGVADGMNVSNELAADSGYGCTEKDVLAGVYAPGERDEPDPAYVCQATQLPYATTDLPWWDLRQYVEDFTSGNVDLARLVGGSIYAAYNNTINLGIGLGGIMRWLYDRFQVLRGGIRYPRRLGTIPEGQPTPLITLNLQPGDLVRVKSYDEILKSVNTKNKNRGLYFDAEMVPYCGRSYRVLKRVNKILDEKTGKMLTMKNPSIILEGVYCQARYSECRMFCPRGIYSYWREGWLERIPDGEIAQPAGSPNQITQYKTVS